VRAPSTKPKLETQKAERGLKGKEKRELTRESIEREQKKQNNSQKTRKTPHFF
jgi:hypothetical protein